MAAEPHAVSPVTVDQDLLYRHLVDSGSVARLAVTASTGSTNADLIEAAAAEDFAHQWPHISVLIAEEQTAGRGRLGRHWSSAPRTSVAVSFVLRSAVPADQRHWMIMLISVALVQTLREFGVDAALKWPNDVHVQGRKIAGVLAQVPSGDPGALIVGVGLNVRQQPDQLPVSSATSLIIERRRRTQTQDPDAPGADLQESHHSSPDQRASLPRPEPVREIQDLRTAVLMQWIPRAAAAVRRWEANPDSDAARKQVMKELSTLGEQVRVEEPAGTAVRGTAVGLTRDGSLTVEVTGLRATVLDPEAGGGEEHLWQAVAPYRASFSAGDVVHLRAVRVET